MRFGVRLPNQGEMGAESSGWAYVAGLAREVEALGYDGVWIPDHLVNAHLQYRRPMLEFWTTITAIAAQTERIRVGGHTMSNPFRHPAVLAKMAATLSEVAPGRFVLCMGSAWFDLENRLFGLPYEDHDGRVARTREAVTVIKRLWTEPEVDFAGDFYAIRGGVLEPKPSPRPEIWLGGDSPATRRLVSELADTWLFYSKSPEQTAGLLADYLGEGGRPVGLATSAVLIVGDRPSDIIEWSERYAAERKHRFAVPPTPEDVRAANLCAVASDPEPVVERLERWRELGIEYVIIQPIPPRRAIRWFAEHVAPRLQSVPA